MATIKWITNENVFCFVVVTYYQIISPIVFSNNSNVKLGKWIPIFLVGSRMTIAMLLFCAVDYIIGLNGGFSINCFFYIYCHFICCIYRILILLSIYTIERENMVIIEFIFGYRLIVSAGWCVQMNDKCEDVGNFVWSFFSIFYFVFIKLNLILAEKYTNIL